MDHAPFSKGAIFSCFFLRGKGRRYSKNEKAKENKSIN